MKLWQDNIFTSVCQEFCPGGGGSMHGRGLCMVGGGMHGRGDMHGKGGREACVAGGMHGSGVCMAGVYEWQIL